MKLLQQGLMAPVQSVEACSNPGRPLLTAVNAAAYNLEGLSYRAAKCRDNQSVLTLTAHELPR